MLPLSRRLQIWIGLVLGTLLVVTRDYHFATIDLLPSASWAVFFLAGVSLTPIWVFPALFVTAALLDFAAVTWGGVSSFCISPAYGFLVPAYGALWLAGRRYAAGDRPRWSTLPAFGGYLAGGAVVCELLSSGSFYFISARFTQPTLSTFGWRFAKYFPASLESLLFYVGVAAVIHAVGVTLDRSVRRRAEGVGR